MTSHLTTLRVISSIISALFLYASIVPLTNGLYSFPRDIVLSASELIFHVVHILSIFVFSIDVATSFYKSSGVRRIFVYSCFASSTIFAYEIIAISISQLQHTNTTMPWGGFITVLLVNMGIGSFYIAVGVAVLRGHGESSR